MGKHPIVSMGFMLVLLLVGPVVTETTDVCLNYDCTENPNCPPDSSIDDDFYDDTIVYNDDVFRTEAPDLERQERHVPPRFQRNDLFDKCCNIDKVCKCNQCSKPPKCTNTTHIPIRTRESAKSPGDCCDTFECQPIPNCAEEPNAKWHTECKDCRCMGGIVMCSQIENCEVQPQEEQPASCLSSELKRIFEHGAEWKESDDCLDCRCEAGDKKCIRTDCKQPQCENPVKIPGQCCKVCPKVTTEVLSGCHSTTMQKIFNHGDEWREADGCMECRCEDGEIKCESSYCKPLDCKETIKLPGQCCRVCVEEKPDVESPASNWWFQYDNLLFLNALVLLPIILLTIICCVCCRRHNFHEKIMFCHRKFVPTTNLKRYSTIHQSDLTVTTTAPPSPTLR